MIHGFSLFTRKAYVFLNLKLKFTCSWQSLLGSTPEQALPRDPGSDLPILALDLLNPPPLDPLQPHPRISQIIGSTLPLDPPHPWI